MTEKRIFMSITGKGEIEKELIKYKKLIGIPDELIDCLSTQNLDVEGKIKNPTPKELAHMEIKIGILTEMLEKRKISKQKYCVLGNFCENGVVLNWVNGIWYTYCCKNFRPYGLTKHENIDFAIKSMIQILSSDESMYERMVSEYNDLVIDIEKLYDNVGSIPNEKQKSITKKY